MTSTLALYVAEVHQPHQIARETLVTAVTQESWPLHDALRYVIERKPVGSSPVAS